MPPKINGCPVSHIATKATTMFCKLDPSARICKVGPPSPVLDDYIGDLESESETESERNQSPQSLKSEADLKKEKIEINKLKLWMTLLRKEEELRKDLTQKVLRLSRSMKSLQITKKIPTPVRTKKVRRYSILYDVKKIPTPVPRIVITPPPPRPPVSFQPEDFEAIISAIPKDGVYSCTRANPPPPATPPKKPWKAKAMAQRPWVSHPPVPAPFHLEVTQPHRQPQVRKTHHHHHHYYGGEEEDEVADREQDSMEWDESADYLCQHHIDVLYGENTSGPIDDFSPGVEFVPDADHCYSSDYGFGIIGSDHQYASDQQDFDLDLYSYDEEDQVEGQMPENWPASDYEWEHADLEHDTDGEATDLNYDPCGAAADLYYDPDEETADFDCDPGGAAADLDYDPDEETADLDYDPGGAAADLDYDPDEETADLDYDPGGAAADLDHEPDGEASDLDYDPSCDDHIFIDYDPDYEPF